MGALLFFICVENKSVSVVVYGRTVALTPRAAVFFYFVLTPIGLARVRRDCRRRVF